MTVPALILRHLCLTGPGKPSALVTFDRGLNVLYGASETGKSFVMEAIDFMLGARGPLRDIPERVGYDRVFLGLENTEGATHTLVRGANGGQFQLFDGLHECLPADAEPILLRERHSGESDDNVSSFLLGQIGLDGKRVRKNVRAGTKSLSFRNLSHLCLISEGDVQKQQSPIEGGQATERTAEYAVFKLLLTGVDDSALVSAPQNGEVVHSRTAKLELIDELIGATRERIEDDSSDPQDLIEQLRRLESSIERWRAALLASEEQHQSLAGQLRELHRRLQSGLDRRAEIGELLARFALLATHYQSDLARLDGVREAGSLVEVLAPRRCPLCGAEPGEQHLDSGCDGDVDAVIAAAEAESVKIARLDHELAETVCQLEGEAVSFERLLPKVGAEAKALEQTLDLSRPELAEQRAVYADLLDKRASVQATLAIWGQLAELEERRAELDQAEEAPGGRLPDSAGLSSTTLDAFAQQVERLLKCWNFPDADRVYFDQGKRDLVISGKLRGSRGKGMRAITHSAFTVGLLEFCREKGTAHPGFVILDSPLLAYREPEGEEDDLSGTDVQDRFYDHVARYTDRQVIVIENTDPPEAIRGRQSSEFFSKNPHVGRYGFFPIGDGNA